MDVYEKENIFIFYIDYGYYLRGKQAGRDIFNGK